MTNIEMKQNKFNKVIKEATDKLQNFEFEESYKNIIIALSGNPHAPEPHNLLGIWYEFKGNNELARKHYRAAYALDPCYKPASTNLERVCTIFAYKSVPFDFGEIREEEPIEANNEKNIEERRDKACI